MADLSTFMEVDDGAGNALRVLGNNVGVLLVSAARTATVLGASMANPTARGLFLYLNVTAVSGTTPTLALRLNVQDPITGTSFVMTTFATVNAAGEYVYLVYPTAIAAGLTGSLNSVLPHTWSVDAVIAGTTPSFTFSLGYGLAN